MLSVGVLSPEATKEDPCWTAEAAEEVTAAEAGPYKRRRKDADGNYAQEPTMTRGDVCSMQQCH